MVAFALLLVAAPVDVTYKKAEPFVVHPWEAGATAWVVRDSGMQSSMEPESTRTEVPFGSQVTIINRVGDMVSENERRDYWYEVDFKHTRGFMFGGDLTPAAFEGDFDGDKKPELITVHFAADLTLHVRYSKRGILKELNLGAFGCCGNVAHVELIDKKQAGTTLLRLVVESAEGPVTVLVLFTGPQPQEAFRVPGREDELVIGRNTITMTATETLYRLKKGKYVISK